MTQATVHEFLRRGNFEPNLERVRGLLRARRDAMLDALDLFMPEGATWSRPEGGYFIWLDLPMEAGDLLARAEAAGVTFVKGTDFFADGSGTSRCGSRSASSRRTRSPTASRRWPG